MFLIKPFFLYEQKVKIKIWGIMLPSKWEDLSCCSTKLTHFCKKNGHALNCRQSKYSLQICNICGHAFFWVGKSFSFQYPLHPLQNRRTQSRNAIKRFSFSSMNSIKLRLWTLRKSFTIIESGICKT